MDMALVRIFDPAMYVGWVFWCFLSLLWGFFPGFLHAGFPSANGEPHCVPCEQSLFDLPRSVGKRKRLCERLRYSLKCRSSEKMDESVKFWTRQTGFTLLRMINSSNCWLIPRPRYFVCSLQGISSRCHPKVLSMLVGMTRSIPYCRRRARVESFLQDLLRNCLSKSLQTTRPGEVFCKLLAKDHGFRHSLHSVSEILPTSRHKFSPKLLDLFHDHMEFFFKGRKVDISWMSWLWSRCHAPKQIPTFDEGRCVVQY